MGRPVRRSPGRKTHPFAEGAISSNSTPEQQPMDLLDPPTTKLHDDGLGVALYRRTHQTPWSLAVEFGHRFLLPRTLTVCHSVSPSKPDSWHTCSVTPAAWSGC